MTDKCVKSCKNIPKYKYYSYNFKCYFNSCPCSTFFDEKVTEENSCIPLELKKPDCTLEDIILDINNCSLENKYNNTNEGKIEFIQEIENELKNFKIITKNLSEKDYIIKYFLYNETYQFLAFSNKKKMQYKKF